MTVTKIRTDGSAVKQLLASDKEFLKPLIQGRSPSSATRPGWTTIAISTWIR